MEKKQGFDFWRTTLKSAKMVVAPMVDQSELPWRLLSRRYGAQLCYTPMLHASVFIRDHNYRKDALVSCHEDRPLIVQFCANDPDTLLKAAKYTEGYCDAVDLNLGCPQAIARRGHYGAFLQDEWELLQKMIGLCATELNIPITAKIRVFEDIDKTVQYAKMLEAAGVQLLTVHGRTKEKKGRKTALASWKHIKAVKENVQIPVFANGNIQYLSDVYKCIEETGVDGIMTAEGNLHNPGLFDGRDHKVWDMATEYLEIVEKYPCPLAYVRGHIFKIFHHALQVHKHVRDILANSKSIAHIKEGVILLQQYAKDDVQKYEEDPATYKTDLPRPYWICQPYVRPTEEESSDPSRQKVRDREEEFENLKRAMSVESNGEEELSRNKLKKMKRHHLRFLAKSKNEKEKYIMCGCGNPKGKKCVFDSCKACCRDKAFREKLDCAGHKLLVTSKIHWREKKCIKPETESNISANMPICENEKLSQLNTDRTNSNKDIDSSEDKLVQEQVQEKLKTDCDMIKKTHTACDVINKSDVEAQI